MQIRFADRLPLLLNRVAELEFTSIRNFPSTVDFLHDQLGRVAASLRDGAPRFTMDHVVNYWANLGKDEYDPTTDFPCVLPPFPVCWLEAVAPPFVRYADGSEVVWNTSVMPRVWGVLLTTRPTADVRDTLENMEEGHTAPIPSGAAYTVLATLTALMPHDTLVLLGTYVYHCADDGSLAKFDDHGASHYSYSPPLPTELVVRYRALYRAAFHSYGVKLANLGTLLMDPMLLGLSLLHCQNIELATQHPGPKLAKAFAKRHAGAAVHEQRVVHVMPRAQRRAAERTTASGRSSPRFHMVRGHFCHRRSAKFPTGKALWWRAPFVRGNAAQGTVDHTYEVTP